VKNVEIDGLFHELRGASQATPLLNESEVVDALRRSPHHVAARPNPLFLVGATVGIAASIVAVVWFVQPSVDVPSTPITDRRSTVEPQIAAPANAQSLPMNDHPSVTSVARHAKAALVPTSEPRVRSSSARIAGLPFLDLTDAEFAALPDGLQPEIRTRRTSVATASGRPREQRTMECLTHAATSSSVIFNGEEFVQMSAMYIPVRRVEQGAQGRVETVEWFKPTGDLISLLPERYRVPIMLELNLLSEVQRGCITPSEACRSLPHAQSYFDMCRLDASRIKDITFAPNPARTVVSCAVDLRYATTVRFAAYTTSGAYVAELTEALMLDPGVHEVAIPLNGLSPGMYLITAATQDGEHVVRRLIIE